MLSTDTPLTERLTLFWHSHFTSSLHKVKWPPLLYRQNLLLRQHAMGNFRALLPAVAKDPAMILYLDSQTNRQGAPNENFARELLELFTLGEGHYSEQDIKEAARAFTGWEVEWRTGRFRFNARAHDDGQKTFLGLGWLSARSCCRLHDQRRCPYTARQRTVTSHTFGTRGPQG